MKNNVRLTLIIILVVTMLCSALALAACDRDDIAELRVEGAKISFMKGDEFELGEDFAVYADYKDGKSVDVTQEVEIRQEAGMDMNVPGDYQITVIYGQKRTIYTVYVNDSEDILRKIDLDTSAVNKLYKLGDALSTEGLTLTLTYENAQKVLFTVKTASLVGFDVTVTGDGVAENNIFTSMGEFTVSVSKGIVKASYSVTVDGVNISTIQGAIATCGFYGSRAVSGNVLIQGATLHPGVDSATGKPVYQPNELYTAYEYEYAFGNNYTYFKETHWDPSMEYHCGMDEKGFFVTYLEGGVIKPSNQTNPAMMDGLPISLWYSSETAYGAENALKNLYSHALRCSNDDLKETVDESAKQYSFSFSGLEFRDSNSDYYETTVTFTLGEDYAVTGLVIEQIYYENNSSLSSMEGYVPSFTTDTATGKTTPGEEYTYRSVVTVTQATGERTAKNSYDRDMFKVSSYSLMYNGEKLADDSVIELNAGNIYKLKIVEVLPTTANMSLDIMYFDYEGNTGSSDFWLKTEDFFISGSGSEISFSAKRGGTWTLIFRTEKTVKKLTVKVTGLAPEEMQPKLLNKVSGSFYDGNEQTVAIGGSVYFYGAVDRYANAAQTSVINSANGQYATITSETVNGVDCFKFTATQAGMYQITVMSQVAELTRCIFTFTVNEMADFTGLLSGVYTAQDQVGDIYRVTFTLTDAQALEGTAHITRTPTDLDNNPLTEQAVEQTVEFYVDGMEIVVKHSDGELIYVDFALDNNNNLELIDQRSTHYALTKEQ